MISRHGLQVGKRRALNHKKGGLKPSARNSVSYVRLEISSITCPITGTIRFRESLAAASDSFFSGSSQGCLESAYLEWWTVMTRLAFKFLGDASQFLGHRVDMFPVFAVLSVFQYCQVYPGIVFPDFQEMFVVTAVPSEINIPGKRFQQEGGPQRLIGRHSPSGKMAVGQAMDGKTFACYGIFLPVQFGNILFPEPPRFKMLSNSPKGKLLCRYVLSVVLQFDNPDGPNGRV